MKKQLQPKHKVMIGVGTGILGAAAIATPLALTLTQNQSIKAYNLDDVYGVNKSAYNKMKRDTYNLYAAKLEAEGVDPNIRVVKLKEMSSSFSKLDSHVSSIVRNKATNNVYTVATTTLKQIAKNDFGVDAVRTSRANWNEIEDLFSSMKESFVTYMDNHHLGPKKIAEVINDATTRKNQMMEQLKTKYANDILGGVLQAKSQLISLFDTVNTEIAKLAGTIRLAEFMANYSFTFREDAKSWQGVTDTNANRFEVITAHSGALQLHQPIHQDNMNKIFVCYNQETRQAIPFSSDMIPGYTITPVYEGAIIDAEKNLYQIKIDWRLVSQNVADEDKEAATAHLIEMDNETLDKCRKAKNVNSFDDAFNITNKVKLTNYQVLPSSSYATTQLEETYFNKLSNGTNIELTYDDPHAQPCYDGFMYAKQDSTEEQYLSLRQLAQTGIVIRNKTDIDNGRLLKDVIALVDQDNYEPKNIIEKFIKYCDVVDTVKISPEGLITNKLTAAYSNATNWKATKFQDGNGTYTMNCEPSASTNWNVSDDFFYAMNSSFNTAYKHSHLFIDKGYQDINDKATSALVATTFTFLLNLTTTSMVGLNMAVRGLQHRWGDVMVYLPMFAIQVAMTSLSGYFKHKYHTEYLEPIKDYRTRADEFTDSGEYTKVNDKLTDDEHWFILFDKEHPIDKESQLYKDKRQAFNEHFQDKAALQEIFKTYTYFETDFAKKFFEKAYQLQINPAKFKADFSSWKGNGDCAVVQMTFDAGTFLALGLLELMKYTVAQEDIKEEIDENHTTEHTAKEMAKAQKQRTDLKETEYFEGDVLCEKID